MPKNKSYSNKRSNGSNTRTEVKEKMSASSPLSLIVESDSSQVYAVNAQRVDVGGTATAQEIYVKHIPMASTILESSSTPNSLLTDQLQDLINAYATARGYTTGVTTAKVAAYLEYSFNLFSILVFIHKCQNGNEYTTTDGVDLGKLLGSRIKASTGLSAASIANYIGDGAGAIKALEFEGDISYSNTAWSRDWLSHLSKIKLSRGLVQEAISLYSTNYALSPDGSYIGVIFPNTLRTASTAASVRDGIVTNMNNARAADPDLIDILEFLGFTSELVSQMNFDRDQRGLTLSVMYDEVMNAALYNAALESPFASGDSDFSGLYFDKFGHYSVLNPVDTMDFNASSLFPVLMLRGKIGEHYQVQLVRSSDTGVGVDAYAFPFMVNGDNTTVTGLSQAQADRARSVTIPYYLSGMKLPFFLAPSITEVSAGDFQMNGNTVIAADISEKLNAFRLPDDYSYYQLAKKAELIMGDIEWRKAIQLIQARIRPTAVSKSQ